MLAINSLPMGETAGRQGDLSLEWDFRDHPAFRAWAGL